MSSKKIGEERGITADSKLQIACHLGNLPELRLFQGMKSIPKARLLVGIHTFREIMATHEVMFFCLSLHIAEREFSPIARKVPFRPSRLGNEF